MPAKKRKEYEAKHPRPNIGEEFYCKICQRLILIQNNRDVCLDHDHKTGDVRGYICNNCNTGMGTLGDDVGMLSRAIQWLKGTLTSLISL